MNFWFDSNFDGLAGNGAFYKNPQVDELVQQAATLTDLTIFWAWPYSAVRLT